MVPADTYDHMLEYLSRKGWAQPYMCGLLFAPEKTAIGKAIYDRLLDWHYQSGKHFDIFCVGYGNWTTEYDQKPIARIAGSPGTTPIDFYYNPMAFDNIRRTVQSASGWRYSGEADLLLVNVIHPNDSDVPRLDFDNLIALDVDRLVRENIFPTPSRLLAKVCDAAGQAAQSGEALTVTEFSDQQVLGTALRGAMTKIVATLKLDTVIGARHFLVGANFLK